MAGKAARRSPGEGSVATYVTGKKKVHRYRSGVVVLEDGTRVPYPGKGGFSTVTAARKALRKARDDAAAAPSQAQDGTAAVSPAVVITVGEQLDALIATVRNEKTRGTYRSAADAWLKPRICAIPLDGLTADRVVTLVVDLEKSGARPTKKNPGGKLGAVSVGLAVVVLGAALQMAVDAGKLGQNVARAKPVRKLVLEITAAEIRAKREAAVPKWWTRQQLNRFLGWASENDVENYLVWRVYAFAGVRNFEGLALQWRDIDEIGKLHLRVTKYGKPRKQAPRLDRVMLRMLGEYREERMRIHPSLAEDGAFIFGDENGRPPTGSANGQRFKSTVAACRASLGAVSLPAITLHGLRHTYASQLLMQGKPVTYVAELLGDTVEVVMETYAHAIPDDDASPGDDLAAAVEGDYAMRMP